MQRFAVERQDVLPRWPGVRSHRATNPHLAEQLRERRDAFGAFLAHHEDEPSRSALRAVYGPAKQGVVVLRGQQAGNKLHRPRMYGRAAASARPVSG